MMKIKRLWSIMGIYGHLWAFMRQKMGLFWHYGKRWPFLEQKMGKTAKDEKRWAILWEENRKDGNSTEEDGLR